LLAHVDVFDHEDLGAYVAVDDLALVHVLDRVHQLAGGTYKDDAIGEGARRERGG
jgi:hypothetical protein